MGTSLLILLALSLPNLFAKGGHCVRLFEGEYVSRPAGHAQRPLREKKQLVVATMNLNRFFVKRPHLIDKTLPKMEQEGPLGVPEKSFQEILAYNKALKELDADVYVFQEVIGSYSTKALDPWGEYIHLADTPADMAGMQTVFMVRKSLEVEAKVILPKTMDADTTPRGLPVLKIRAKNAEGKIIDPQNPNMMIMGVHLKSPRNINDATYDRVKNKEMQAIQKAYREIRQRFLEVPFMVTGDFNMDTFRNQTLVTTINRELENSFDIAHPEFNVFDRATKYFLEANGRINHNSFDAAYISKNLKKNLKDSFVFHWRDENGNLMGVLDEAGVLQPKVSENNQVEIGISDHLPVVSVFQF
mgnify:CR=1 FL=1|tara:strand:+ start:11844 stop:12917 length:1074 start_codon:yes stop_codon:yes gene_type:complete